MNFGQSNCLVFEEFTIKSKILNESIRAGIYKPENYNGQLQKYRSIFVLDGDYLSPLAATNVESLSSAGNSTPCIIISILSNNRQRDFTPVSDSTGYQDSKGSGGADHFLKFLENELIPQVEKKYNLSENRIILGHSLGGLLAYYSFLYNERLFPTIISIDGSLWWDHGTIGKKFIEKMTRMPNYHGEIFECRKDINQPVQFKPNLELLKYLAFQRPPGLNYHYLEIKNANHATIIYPGIYYSLKAILSH